MTDYTSIINYLIKEIKKQFGLVLKDNDKMGFDIRDMELFYIDEKMNYSSIAKTISKYTPEDLLNKVIAFLKKKEIIQLQDHSFDIKKWYLQNIQTLKDGDYMDFANSLSGLIDKLAVESNRTGVDLKKFIKKSIT